MQAAGLAYSWAGLPRNASCGAWLTRCSCVASWVGCYESTVLGPTAGRAGGTVGGMPLSQLVDAWEAPFRSEDTGAGGCPALPTPPLPATLGEALAQAGRGGEG